MILLVYNNSIRAIEITAMATFRVYMYKSNDYNTYIMYTFTTYNMVSWFYIS